MEAPSNGGLLYHEVQESNLCAVHCVNTVLQGPFFSEIDLAALASDLDRTERQMMTQAGEGASSGDFLMEGSHNVSLGGDFSIQVLEKALGVWDLQVIPFNSPVAEASNYDPELETSFICHLLDHWFSIRKVNGEWYNFNSLYVAPEHLSKFYLSAFLDTLRGSGWSIFVVRGNFPKDCPIPSSNAFGQWLTPEDALRISKSCNEMKAAPRGQEFDRGSYSSQFANEMDEISAQEEHDLNAAIAASLMDSSAFTTGTSSIADKGISADSPVDGSQSVPIDSVSSLGADTSVTKCVSKEDLDAAIAASLVGSSASAPVHDTGNMMSPATIVPQLNANESSSGAPQEEGNMTRESISNMSDPTEVHKIEKNQDDKDQ